MAGRMPKGYKVKKSTLDAVNSNEHLTYFGAKEDGTSFEKAKNAAIERASRIPKQPTNRVTTEDMALGASSSLRSMRGNNLIVDSGAESGKGTPIPKSELKPLAIGKEPKLKADEAIRAEATKTLRERRTSAARRLAVRGGGEDRRQALVKGLASRKSAKAVQPAIKVQTPKTPGIKLRSVGGVIGAIASAPNTIDSFIQIQKSAKSKRPMKTTEGMRLLLGLPQADEAKFKGKKIY